MDHLAVSPRTCVRTLAAVHKVISGPVVTAPPVVDTILTQLVLGGRQATSYEGMLIAVAKYDWCGIYD